MFWKNKAFKVTVIEDDVVVKDPVDYEKVAKVITKTTLIVIVAYFVASTVSQVCVKMVTFE